MRSIVKNVLKNLLRHSALFVTILVLILSNARPIFAEETTKNIKIDEQKNIVITFVFDEEVVDIKFINPEGEEVDIEADEIDENEKYSTYTIEKAAPGDWKIKYDKKNNNSIDYFISEEQQSLAINAFSINVNEDTLTVNFRVHYKKDISINYEIIAIEDVESDDKNIVNLKKGTTTTNKDESIPVLLSDKLSSGKYIIKLNVDKEQGNFKIFDSYEGDNFTYNNTKEPSEIEDFKLYIDTVSGKATVNIEGYKVKGAKKYRVTFYDTDSLYYKTELSVDKNLTSFLYNKNHKIVKIGVSYLTNNLWSKEKIKIVDLDKEYLYIENYEALGEPYLKFKYKVASGTILDIKVNDKVESKEVIGEGNVISYLDVGKNSIYATLDATDNVVFEINTDKQHYLLPPTLRLAEELDNKTFYSSSIKLIGTAKNADYLLINGDRRINLADNNFSVDYVLFVGKNDIEISAVNSMGDIDRKEFTVYRKTNIRGLIDDIIGNILNYKYIVASFVVGLILLILTIVFAKKRKNKYKISIVFVGLFIAVVAIDAFAIYKYIERVNFTNSIEFISLAEKSVIDAGKYLTMNDSLFKLICGISVFAVILLIMLIYKKVKGKDVKKA